MHILLNDMVPKCLFEDSKSSTDISPDIDWLTVAIEKIHVKIMILTVMRS